MKTLALVLCLAASLPLHAGRRRGVAPPSHALSIEFVDVPAEDVPLVTSGQDAWLELSAVNQRAGSMGDSLRVRRRIGFRIVRAGGVSWGTASVTARLDFPDGRSSLRIDGQQLSGVPLMVNARATVGAVSVHALEIEVPASVAAGPVAASISWEVTSH